MSNGPLEGKVALVTGAGRGIGREIAMRLAHDGAMIVVHFAHSKAGAEQTVADIAAAGGTAVAYQADIAKRAEVKALFTQIDTFPGRLDIVVNNAANALTLPFGSITADAWQKSLDTNLRGPVFLVERALPHLKASGNAAILNVISAGAFLFSANTAMYAASKAGLMAMTRSMAASFAMYGIRVNALAPGTVDTDMVRNNSPEAVASMSNAAFMKRAAHPDEMVGPALLMCSDAGSFLTGQVIIVDGGLTPH